MHRRVQTSVENKKSAEEVPADFVLAKIPYLT